MKTLLSSFLGILLFSMNASATIHNISVADFAFSPTPLNVKLGDTVRWNWVNGVHTTTSTTIPVGAATWNSPMDASTTSFTYVPAAEGVYNYVCSIHASMGMGGSFTVIGPSTVNTTTEKLFSVSPNPAKSEIKINTAGLQLQVSVTDAIGRRVTLPQLSNINNQQRYSVNHLASGVYMLTIRANDNVKVQKLFIE